MAHLGEVGDVDRRLALGLGERHILEERDDVVHVLLVDLADLQLGDEGVDRRDRVVVEVETVADVDVVVHAHDVQEDVGVVDEWRLARRVVAPRRTVVLRAGPVACGEGLGLHVL